MAAQALYLKYRPQTFEGVVGQEPITRTLRNALRQGRIRHAYLFTGPRGTGKTTTARLLAKAVNCLAPEEERPCNVCTVCVAINEGRLLDLIEIDAASNRGIDEIRDIREKVGFRPSEGRYKVYVLDEAHMLTEPAFNALLKTLEEPPPHVIFILVTTDPHKIPATITSRCQRFDFRRIPLQVLVDRLVYIVEQEGLSAEPAALELIAHQGTGAMRDAVSLLDQLAGYGDEIRLDQVQMVLGTVAGEAASRLVAFLAEGDVAGGLDLINRTVSDGADPRQFGREVVEVLRGLLLVREGAGTRLLNATAEQAAEMEALAERFSVEQLLRAIHLFNEAATDLKRGLQTIPQLPLEMALVESIVEQGGPKSYEPPSLRQDAAPIPARPQAEMRRVAEQPSPVLAPSPAAEVRPIKVEQIAAPVADQAAPVADQAAPVADQAAPKVEQAAPKTDQAVPKADQATPTPADTLTLEQVVQAWDHVLQAVRQRNPTTQAVLNTGCRPVEVAENEIVVTFPFTFLRDKLGDPQRKTEIQDALAEVLRTNCRLRLVLAAEYTPRLTSEPTAARPEPSKPAPDTQPLDEQALGKLTRWAEERGGQAKIVPK